MTLPTDCPRVLPDPVDTITALHKAWLASGKSRPPAPCGPCDERGRCWPMGARPYVLADVKRASSVP